MESTPSSVYAGVTLRVHLQFVQSYKRKHHALCSFLPSQSTNLFSAFVTNLAGKIVPNNSKNITTMNEIVILNALIIIHFSQVL